MRFTQRKADPERARKIYEAGAFPFILKWGLLFYGVGTGVISIIRQCFVDGVHQALNGSRLFQDAIDSFGGGLIWGGLMWWLFAWQYRRNRKRAE